MNERVKIVDTTTTKVDVSISMTKPSIVIIEAINVRVAVVIDVGDFLPMGAVCYMCYISYVKSECLFLPLQI